MWNRLINALLAVTIVTTPAVGQDATVSVKDGIYSAAQAERGKALMDRVCSECHTPEEFTDGFMESWAGATVADLFDQLRSTMPEDNPGSLAAGEYVEALAYIFQLNGLPPGQKEMASGMDALQRILIERQ